MKGILEDFLSLGKLEEGKVQVKTEILEADECIADFNSAIGEMEHLLKVQGQTFVLKHKIVKSNLHADRNMLKSIFINLISNAIKFSGDNKPIEIFLDFSEDNFTMTVKDSGIGIPKQDQVHLFDRFFRAGNAANIQGSGLGLHIIGKYRAHAGNNRNKQ